MNKCIVVLLALSLWACNKSEKMQLAEESREAMAGEFMMDNTVQERDNKAASPSDITANLKLIKTGNVSFEVEELRATADRINAAIKKHGGYASNESESKNAGQINRTISIRVPSGNFDGLLADISQGVDHFDSKDISVADVTEEFVDATARLHTKKQIEVRYIQLLSKAGKITEMLEVEKQLGEIRTEIEQIEGRLKYLNSQVSLSTLNINYYQTFTVSSSQKTGFFSKVKSGFVRGWDLILSVIIGLVSIWPLFLIGVGVYFVVRRFRK
jgi:hypothetical protein